MAGEDREIWCVPHKIRGESLLNTGFLTDLTLFIGPERREIKVHKLILASGSKVLYTQIQNSTDNEKLELPNVNVGPNIFLLLLKYLYTGFSQATMAEALPLLKLATDFELEELRDQCASILKGKLTEETALGMFQAAMEYAHDDLIKSSLDYICRNAIRILEQEAFSSLRLDCLVEIIQQDKLQAKDEIQVFNATYRWGIAECKRQNLDETDPASLQKTLSKPLKHVRFPLMDKEKFALEVATKNVLNMEESMTLLMCFLVSSKNRLSLSGGRFLFTPRHSLTSRVKVWGKWGFYVLSCLMILVIVMSIHNTRFATPMSYDRNTRYI